MTDVFTIRLDQYQRVCKARVKAGLDFNPLLLGTLIDLGPCDVDTGDYVQGETFHTVDDVWRRLNLVVPDHLKGHKIRILRED